ncbi:Soluble lytic murein transglycosylase andrelated regulatory proteins (some contain LysM/invasindomains) [Candidatus Paraburkholderia kirkii UZHbot1]|uniref:Soluble lytic murein transglycosylase andrelated regulatory proteins (Some contain LysM/invasindomains) n=1 Tax=Candidatus Paraburkholderia kirkii UZHbot1 TaxID=1055526 RepID=G4MD75_9BURK|nr:Soluble lytic murein transglycosylase andrelated regulatory proteins (some contain LysM/invasindomains) [Candidatus Paraburkholderia kirkii UZHbot1]
MSLPAFDTPVFRVESYLRTRGMQFVPRNRRSFCRIGFPDGACRIPDAAYACRERVVSDLRIKYGLDSYSSAQIMQQGESMNPSVWWGSDTRAAQIVRMALRRGRRLSHHLFSLVGCAVVVTVVALWLLPSWRTTFAARIMPFVSAAVQAGPARLLAGQPLLPFSAVHHPSTGPMLPVNLAANAASAKAPAAVTPSLGATVSDDESTHQLTGGISLAVSPNGLDPRTMPSVGMLASMIPAQRVVADARDDRVLVSTREQKLVANFIARRYRVAEEPVSKLVRAAFDTGREVGLDPLLLLSVMAIESGFNPYAESGVGAQGLMQVMSKVHSDKFQDFGGSHAALDPLANIKVGALVLKDCIARGGSVAGGLRYYVGSTTQDDGGYGAKVLAERARLRDVARGRAEAGAGVDGGGQARSCDDRFAEEADVAG